MSSAGESMDSDNVLRMDDYLDREGNLKDDNLEITPDISPTDMLKDGEGNFKELNDMMLGWVGKFDNKIEEKRDDMSEEAYDVLKQKVNDMANRHIAEEYVDNLCKHLDDVEIDFFDKKNNAKKKAKLFDRFVNNTCRRIGVATMIYKDMLNKYFEFCCETKHETNVMKGVLYELSLHPSVNNSEGSLSKYEMSFKFLNLFLMSMKDYNQRILNKIVKKYNEFTDNE